MVIIQQKKGLPFGKPFIIKCTNVYINYANLTFTAFKPFLPSWIS
ncbi:MAG: hypothetical protein ACI9C9_002008 [Marivirga sp.]|jgi:hypothetical protein